MSFAVKVRIGGTMVDFHFAISHDSSVSEHLERLDTREWLYPQQWQICIVSADDTSIICGISCT